MKAPAVESPRTSWVFVTLAVAISTAAGVFSIVSFATGAVADGFTLAGVSAFTGWMAVAIVQFHARLREMDGMLRDGERRAEQSDALVGELRREVERARSNPPDADGPHTLH